MMEDDRYYSGEALMAVKFGHIAEPCFIPCSSGPIATVIEAMTEYGGEPSRKLLYRVNIKWKTEDKDERQ